MFSALVLASGIYIMWFGGVVHHLPLSVPHPHGVCQTDRELGRKLQERLERLVIEPGAIQETLVKENLAAPYPYDWCAPRARLRPTIEWWMEDVWNRGGADVPPVVITMPRRRPTFVPVQLVLEKYRLKPTINPAVTVGVLSKTPLKAVRQDASTTGGTNALRKHYRTQHERSPTTNGRYHCQQPRGGQQSGNGAPGTCAPYMQPVGAHPSPDPVRPLPPRRPA